MMDNTQAAQQGPTPESMQRRWTSEMSAARQSAEDWQKEAKEVTEVYLDDREDFFSGSRLNLFSANVNTLMAMLYGQEPGVDVSREHGDANDDDARVAAEMLSRLLNARPGIGNALGLVLNDRMLAGLGMARVRYDVDIERIEHPEQTTPQLGFMIPSWTEERKSNESAPVDHVNWRDVLWSPARTWGEVRWVAFRSFMTRKALRKRFGDEIAEAIPLSATTRTKDGHTVAAVEESVKSWQSVRQRAEIWEIWDKDSETVYWYCEGMDVICDARPDPLELEGFFPCPEPLLANPTTGGYTPRTDYMLSRDQYEHIDELTTRIDLLVRALRVVGVYDRSAGALQRMLTEARENDMIPVDSWAAFAERGGIKGAVDWLPIEQVAAVIAILTQQREQAIALLYQTTGMSDILRGASNPVETASAQSIKARFASVRIQHLQDELARFATDLQRLRAQVVAKHFSDGTIVKITGMARTPDAQLIPGALALIRDPEAQWRLDIEPAAMAARDLAEARAEKAEFIQGLSMFLNAAMPVAKQYPAAMPALLEMLKWTMTGFSGAATIEGVLDRAIASMEQMPSQEPPPDPVQVKAKVDMAKLQADAAAQAEKIRLQAEADIAKIQAQARADVGVQAAQAAFDVRADVRTDVRGRRND